MAGFEVFATGAILIALAAWWCLRAWRRAGEAGPARGPLIASGVAGVAALSLYLLIGSPFAADGAYRDRIEALKTRAPETYSVEEGLAILDEAARTQPNDPRPLLVRGDILLQLNNTEQAAVAYEEALRRDSNSPYAMIGLGRALVLRDRRMVGPYAKRLFERAREIEPLLPDPYFFLGLHAVQNGKTAEARRLMGEAKTRLPEDDPRRVMIDQMLAAP